MVGLGGAGGLGGLGGMGTSFPARHTAPNSQTVDYMPVATDWLSDWQARYDAEEAKRRAATPGVSYDPRVEALYRDVLGRAPDQEGAAYYTSMLSSGMGLDALRDTFTANAQPEIERGFSLAPAVASRPGSPGYTPDFTALNAEKQKMQPLFEAQTANTQAYQNMTGNGMIGGVLGPGYEAPNFGQINGEFGQTTAGAQTGLDMNWTDGAYKPGGTNSGVYAPNPYNTIRWGL